jgi:nitrilase
MNVTRPPSDGDGLIVGLAQIAPAWLDREASIGRVVATVEEAGASGCQLVAFGEAFVPGYPWWVERMGGAAFDDPIQKALFGRYAEQAVDIERGDLATVCDAARRAACTVVLGVIERPADRGGHSLYCSMVTIDANGAVTNVHRKLQPTHEERLVWSPGDGHGLRVLRVGPFTLGGLNCWENWMPLPRAALHGLGEDLHLALWPGSVRNTADLTRVLAREGRSYVLSVSSVFHTDDVPDTIPELAALRAGPPEWYADGGSCIASPDGNWLVEPRGEWRGLIIATLDHRLVREERQNFDPSGHYSRPDVTRLLVDRRRQSTVTTRDTAE